MGSARRGPAAAGAGGTGSARADASASGGVMRRRCLVLEAAAFMVRGRLRRREAAGEMLARGEKEDGRCPALGSGSVSRGLPLGEGPKSYAPGAWAPRPKGGRGRLTHYPNGAVHPHSWQSATMMRTKRRVSLFLPADPPEKLMRFSIQLQLRRPQRPSTLAVLFAAIAFITLFAWQPVAGQQSEQAHVVPSPPPPQQPAPAQPAPEPA